MNHTVQTGSDELKAYESICNLSKEMMIAAKKGEWDRVVALGQKHHELIDIQRNSSNNDLIKKNELIKKTELIQKILSSDTQTKKWVQDRMDALKNGFETERKCLKTYSMAQVQEYTLSQSFS